MKKTKIFIQKSFLSTKIVKRNLQNKSSTTNSSWFVHGGCYYRIKIQTSPTRGVIFPTSPTDFPERLFRPRRGTTRAWWHSRMGAMHRTTSGVQGPRPRHGTTKAWWWLPTGAIHRTTRGHPVHLDAKFGIYVKIGGDRLQGKLLTRLRRRERACDSWPR